MIKKYNVFISSTYDDLIEERKKVADTLISMDCTPKNMELFYAPDMSTWDFIKEILLSCDYYIVILAGRYGSICEQTGQSFTQMEYEFAVNNHIPIGRFVYKNPDNLPFNKHDKNINYQIYFDKFRQILQEGQVVKYWSTPDELSCYVAVSLHHFILNHLDYSVDKKQEDIFIKLDKIISMLCSHEKYDIHQLLEKRQQLYIAHDKKIIYHNDDKKILVTEYDRDLISEIGNISLSCGFTGLSGFFDNIKIIVSIPRFEVCEKLSYIIKKGKEDFFILFTFQGEISGKVLLNYKKKFLFKIYQFIKERFFINDNFIPNIMVKSALQEISNIFVGSTLTSFSSLFFLPTRITDIHINGAINDNIRMWSNDDIYTVKLTNNEKSFESILILEQDSINKIKQIYGEHVFTNQ